MKIWSQDRKSILFWALQLFTKISLYIKFFQLFYIQWFSSCQYKLEAANFCSAKFGHYKWQVIVYNSEKMKLVVVWLVLEKSHMSYFYLWKYLFYTQLCQFNKQKHFDKPEIRGRLPITVKSCSQIMSPCLSDFSIRQLLSPNDINAPNCSINIFLVDTISETYLFI